jgi:hypothetical protein
MHPPLVGASRSAAFGTRDETERNAIRVITSFLTLSRSRKDRRGLTIGDTRFDGKKIHKANRASQAIYDIRGKYIHEANSASQPVYEIRGGYIHKAHSASQPEFEIRGNRIHKAHSASQAIYEIR